MTDANYQNVYQQVQQLQEPQQQKLLLQHQYSQQLQQLKEREHQQQQLPQQYQQNMFTLSSNIISQQSIQPPPSHMSTMQGIQSGTMFNYGHQIQNLGALSTGTNLNNAFMSKSFFFSYNFLRSQVNKLYIFYIFFFIISKK